MLVERTRELATLQHVLEDCLRGRSGVAMITGARATGKTALLHAFGEEVQRSGALLLNASCTPGERSLPLGVLSQLQRNIPLEYCSGDRAAYLAGLLDEAASPIRTGEGEAEGAEVKRGHVLHQLGAALLNIAEQRPIVVVVDDAQYMDDLSKETLRHVLGRLRSASVAVVFTECVGSREPRSLFHTEFLRHPHCHSIRLTLLSPAGVGEMVASELDSRIADAFGAQYYEVTGGNPLLVRALLEDQQRVRLGHGDAPVAEPVVGEGFAEAVMSCLHRGDPAVREAAYALAVLDAQSDRPKLFGRMVDRCAKTAAKDVESLVVMGLLRGDSYRHPAIREAVMDDALANADLPDLHLKAAWLLAQDGAEPRTVAGHLVAAGTDCPEWALPMLREAAEAALLDDKVEEAVEYLELAVRDQSEETPIELVMMLVRLKLRLSPASALQHVPALGEAMREGRLLGRGLLWFVRFLVVHGRVDDVTEGLARLVDRMDELDEHSRAEITITRMWAVGSYPEIVSGLPAEVSDPDHVSVDVDMRVQAATALTKVIGGHFDDGVVMTAERVLQSANLAEEPTEEVSAALRTLLYLEKLDSVKSWCDTLIADRHESSNPPGWRGELAMIRAEVALRMGDLGAARRHAMFAMDKVDPRTWGASVGMALGTLLQATTAMGKFDEAAEALAQRVPQHIYRGRYGLHYLFAKGHHHLATRQLPAALGDFLSCGELMVKWRLDSPGLLPWRTGAAEVYLRLGNQAKARELVDQQLALPVMGPSLSRGIAMRVKAATLDLRQRSQLLHGALDEVQAAGGQLEVARVLADLSHTHHQLGEPDRARMMVRRAWRVAKDCQAEPLCAQLIPDQNRTVGTSGDTGSECGAATLSDAERRVAGLAALGHTNREIANKLYVTISTVEQHLTKAYRKLNVTQRKDLPADLWSDAASIA
ncbi:AAA family ATPase [Umezawaea sp. Da 62-37]|uniref:helix-turn-helix transcriptional regulator n=1 Tax=Umezawaea sp. Da 62-37 TaxID=3075927 RepID=UPI0028F726E0|nr:AAA family ATPase [Umezawaea sp. Da 62-37]WNV84053.1 AAA family ATPase [Umezawaea sp. Da 62-37]